MKPTVSESTSGGGAGRVHPAQRRIERCEQLVGGECIGAGQPVEQRRFAGVRVADQRHGADRGTAPRASLRRALALDARKPLAQDFRPLAEEPAVGLELRFAGSAEADAAFLPLEVGPAADETRQLMLDLRELDLQLAFGAARAEREDVEDQARAIDDAAFERALEIALLRAGERMVEDDEIGAGFHAARRDLLDLAFARERRGVGSLAPAGHRARDRRAGGDGERVELRHALVGIGVAEIKRDQQRAVAASGAFEH